MVMNKNGIHIQQKKKKQQKIVQCIQRETQKKKVNIKNKTNHTLNSKTPVKKSHKV